MVPYDPVYEGRMVGGRRKPRAGLSSSGRGPLARSIRTTPPVPFLTREEIGIFLGLWAAATVGLHRRTKCSADYPPWDRRLTPRRFSRRTWPVGGVRPGRPVEVGGAASAQARMDRGERTIQARGRSTRRLEIICHAYLLVATPVQMALPALLRRESLVRGSDPARVAENLRELGRTIRRHPSCRQLQADGGWSAIVKVPAIAPEEALVVDLLAREHVRLHQHVSISLPRPSSSSASCHVPKSSPAALRPSSVTSMPARILRTRREEGAQLRAAVRQHSRLSARGRFSWKSCIERAPVLCRFFGTRASRWPSG